MVLAGLTAQLKLLMIECVSQLMVNLQLCFLLLTRLLAVMAQLASLSAAEAAKSALLGPGSLAKV